KPSHVLTYPFILGVCMRVLLSWLKEYIDITETPTQLAELLTNAGLEVEGIEKITPTFQGVIAARVTKSTKHPNAEKLSLAEVFDGKTTHSIVCGAPNCREGIFVAFAPIGATLYPDGLDKPQLTISKATIRGVESSGMLCSEKELALADESNGIIELEEVTEGTSLDTLFQDVAFEIGLTPNLGHCMSILGIARELSAVLGRPLKKKSWQSKEGASFSHQPGEFTISIDAKELCPRYSALLIKGVREVASPFWLRLQLERSGIRSINAIVDVTNLISHAIGQPLHAFDADTLHGKEIKVRTAKQNEEIRLLDGTVKRLSDETLVICDAVNAAAVAGVMGDLRTGVSDKTTSIVLESAFFSPVAVRRARKALGLMTESSKRFERGTDKKMTVVALQYAYELIKKIFPQAEIGGFYDVEERAAHQAVSTCRVSRTEKILGYSVSRDQMERIFSRLGFQVKWDGEDLFHVQVPSYRHDIHEEIDLIEEVSRSLGMNSEKATVNQYIGSELPHSPLFVAARQMRQRLLAEELQEFITCNLISPKMVEVVRNHPIDPASVVRVSHPMSEEQSVLRPSLLPGFLDVVKRNINQRTLDIAGFEIGNVHFKKDNQYQERQVLGIVLSGSAFADHFDSSKREFDFLDIKGIVENLLGSLFVASVHFEPSDIAIFHPGRQAKVISSGLQIGTIGELHPAVLRTIDIPQRVLFAEFDIQDLLALPHVSPQFEQLAAFPGSERDWTATVAEGVTYEAILSAIHQLASPLLEKVSLVAIFRHEKLGPNNKNVTLRFRFRDRLKTISQENVDQEHQRLTTGILKSIQESSGREYSV
ncbi:MAG: pheT, partial [Chlamydiia bacterium]|nr:pheT [Chlamydiia bacterium]